MNQNLSIKEKETLDSLLNITEGIYKQYQKLIKLEIDNPNKDKSKFDEFQKEKKKLNLIIGLESDYYIELFNNMDNIYLYINYFNEKVPNTYKVSDIDAIIKYRQYLPVKRICKKLDEALVYYSNFYADKEDLVEIEFVNDADANLSEEDKNLLLNAIYNEVDSSYKTTLFYTQMSKEHNINFMFYLKNMLNKGSNKINNSLISLKYLLCFFDIHLENSLFESDYNITDNLFYDFNKERLKNNINLKEYTEFFQDESLEEIYCILDTLLVDNVKGLKKIINMCDLELYYKQLDDKHKKDLRQEFIKYEKNEENKDLYKICEDMIGKNNKVKVKLKKKSNE
ncbi:MAG: hypothetical protein ACI4OT_01810 [Bacilli bacterium]